MGCSDLQRSDTNTNKHFPSVTILAPLRTPLSRPTSNGKRHRRGEMLLVLNSSVIINNEHRSSTNIITPQRSEYTRKAIEYDPTAWRATRKPDRTRRGTLRLSTDTNPQATLRHKHKAQASRQDTYLYTTIPRAFTPFVYRSRWYSRSLNQIVRLLPTACSSIYIPLPVVLSLLPSLCTWMEPPLFTSFDIAMLDVGAEPTP